MLLGLLVPLPTPVMAQDQLAVATLDADHITTNSATLHGELITMGVLFDNPVTSVEVGFGWGETVSSVGGSAPRFVYLSSPGSFSATITGLRPGVTYWFQACANAGDNKIGAEGGKVLFTTLVGVPPTVATSPASEMVASAGDYYRATLNGYLEEMGTSHRVGVGFEWGSSNLDQFASPGAVAGVLLAPGTFSAWAYPLIQGTTYQFRAKAIGNAPWDVADGIKNHYGEVLSFTAPYRMTIGVNGNGSTNPPVVGVYDYLPGTVVNITASPDSGWRFAGWTGDVTTIADPSAANTTITVNGKYFITANFNFIRQYTLTIAVSPAEWGTTIPAPGAYLYDEGAQITVTATPSSGWSFAGWSGDASGSANTTTMTMNGNKTVTANFTQTPITIPIIQVTQSVLNFGYVPPGSSKDLILAVKNIGGGILTGMVIACPTFSIVSGGNYSLGAGESQQVIVRYTAPLEEGGQTCSFVFSGGGGIIVQVKGTNQQVGLPWLLLLLGN